MGRRSLEGYDQQLTTRDSIEKNMGKRKAAATPTLTFAMTSIEIRRSVSDGSVSAVQLGAMGARPLTPKLG